ncbi:MAG: dolichyl-phosphate beta-glucosyltransferase [Candidatus Aminicenantaceae bacterium]
MNGFNQNNNGERVDLSIVIPAYNEERRLPHTLESVDKYLQQQSYTFEVIVVDGGSADGTSQVVEAFQKEQSSLRLIRLPKNRGKGFHVRTGILHSRGLFVIFTDADLSTPIKEIEQFWPYFKQDYDVVIGSRRHADSRIVEPQSWLRRFMGRTYNWINRWLGIKDVEDVPCGFKGFRREAASQIFQTVRLNGFSFDAEVLYLVQRKFHLRWKQVPIEWKNYPGSKVRLLRDPVAMILDLIKIKLYDIRGLYKSHSL